MSFVKAFKVQSILGCLFQYLNNHKILLHFSSEMFYAEMHTHFVNTFCTHDNCLIHAILVQDSIIYKSLFI